MSKFELSIASNYVSDWTIVDAVREFFQNAIDQAVTVPDNGWSFDYDYDREVLRICNKNSVLEAQSLLLGSTSKADDEKTVGHFGEGYKIGTLVALRTGHNVTIYNYGKKEVWKPRMVKSRRYKVPILTFFTEQYLIKRLKHQNLVVEVESITREEWLEIVKSNLHLQAGVNYIETSRGRILTNKDQAGRIYVNGLFVRYEKDMEYGYDILPQFLKLDRDRKMVSSFDLQWFTGKMWQEVKEPERIVEIAAKGSGDAKFMGTQMYTEMEEASKVALAKFREEYGDKAIPVRGQSELDHVQETYEDAKPVIVNETYQKLIITAPEYKVTAKIKPTYSKEDMLRMWFSKIKDKLTEEEQQEFIDLVGEEEEPCRTDDVPF